MLYLPERRRGVLTVGTRRSLIGGRGGGVFVSDTFAAATPFVNDTMTDTNGVLLTSHTGESGASPWTRHASYSGDGVITTNRLRLNDAG